MSYVLNLKLKKEPVKKAVSALSVFLIITTFTMSLMSFFSMPQYAFAANDYIDPDGDGSVGSWSSTGANYYTEIDEAVRQPSTPTTTDYISAIANASGNIFINMDSFTDVAIATDVTIWIYHNDGLNGELYVQLWDDDELTTRSTEQVVIQRAADAWDSITFSGVNLTQAQLNTLSVRVRSIKNGGGATATVYVYELYGYVTYSEVQHVVVSTSGTQTASMDISSVDNNVGGEFVITEQVSSRSITDITITETGSVDASADLDNIELYYDLDTSLPYDCAGEFFSGTSTETQFGSTDTDGFSSANGTSTFSDTVTITTTQTMCVYVVLDVTTGASDGEDLDVQITDPSTEVVASAGNVSPATPVLLSGSTTLNNDDVIVSTNDTQTASMNITSVDQYVGGSFVMLGQTAGTQTITDVTITETGSVDAQNDLDNIELYYDYDTSAPYDCESESFSGTSTETQFGSTDTDGFSSANGTSTFSGTATASTTQAVCFYTVLDVTSGASNGELLDIQITDASNDVVLSAGTVEPDTVVAISGSTQLSLDDVVVSSVGTQTANMDIPSVNQYVGGSFAIVGQTAGTHTITDVTITETGSVNAQTDLDNIKLYYEYDTVTPYNCESVSYGGAEAPYGSTDTDGFSSANGTSTFS
ncbi:MAG: hypothetical protein KAI72_00235, partial [Candidatus Pacebacteria bacterium]|nr:hypothetical protein [Candidatus Paceibacterota bacterium]